MIVTEPQGPNTQHFWLVAVSTAIVSFGVLTFEVILTRIFSVMLSYHFVFAIISFALLGLGLGGMLLKKWQKWFPSSDYRHTSALFALLIAGSVFAIIKIPVFEHPAFVDLRLWVYIFFATLPFFFSGLVLAQIFHDFAQRSSIIYGFDLLGATLGALTAVPLLNIFGGVNAAIITAGAVVIGTFILSVSKGKWPLITYLSAGVLLIILVAAIPGFLDTEIPIAMDPNKDLYRFLNHPRANAEIVETRWSAFGRTDLVRSELTPDEMSIFVDGAAGSAMYNLDSLMTDENQQTHLLGHFGEYFPFFFLEEDEKDNALIIGPGGGRDVVVTLLGNVKFITAVEVNPDVVQIVKDYKGFNGGIYSNLANVRVIVQEGRNFIRSTAEKYDLIMLALPITKSSRSVDGYALTENYLFTVEAFEDYLNHLTPEGRMVIVAHNNAEIYRLLVLALSALERQNIEQEDAMKHIYTLASGMMPTIVIKRHPFDSLAAASRHQRIHQAGYDRGNFYVPYVPQKTVRPVDRLKIEFEWRMFDQILVNISDGKLTMNQLINSTTIDLSPVSDDSPFFYKFEPALPQPFGLFSLFIVIVIGLFSVPILFVRKNSRTNRPILEPFAAYPAMKVFLSVFFLLGVGFMLIEISLLQKLTLYIGQPIKALSVLLFSLLLGTGIGSLCSSLAKKHLDRIIAAAALLVIILAIIYQAYLANIFAVELNPSLVAAASLLPLGFFLGFPFPLTIRLMKEHTLDTYVDWMWGVNGIASVVGSALTMIIGILSGFTAALYLGVALYGAVALLVIILPGLKIPLKSEGR